MIILVLKEMAHSYMSGYKKCCEIWILPAFTNELSKRGNKGYNEEKWHWSYARCQSITEGLGRNI